jgi:hypothetical protein
MLTCGEEQGAVARQRQTRGFATLEEPLLVVGL